MNNKGLCSGFGVKDASVYLTNIKNVSIIETIGIMGPYDLLSGIEEN